MKYNKVIKPINNFPALICLTENELFTDKEVKKYSIPLKNTVKVNISKNDICFFFGARFENKGDNQSCSN